LQQAVKSARGTSTYAVARDFCRIFAEQMNELYVLSFLLTANHEAAEQGFLNALSDCYRATHVFKDWANSWSRRAVIQNAIQRIQPGKHVPARAPFDQTSEAAALPENGSPLPAVLGLAPFDRFAFVLSVLERYSDHEVKTLLDCTRQDVVQARSRALKQIGKWAQQLSQVAPPARQMFAQAG
jgi:DNA-directed RNA polymerase specialized sigma24 family protein